MGSRNNKKTFVDENVLNTVDTLFYIESTVINRK